LLKTAHYQTGQVDDQFDTSITLHIFWAKPEDYRKGVQRLCHARNSASFIDYQQLRRGLLIVSFYNPEN
jgi:hypothetical protein